ncbi:hypothetical protein SCATT_p09120 (plasmid) [Streptantibioticus cattleyicolor NRRL 8057 = DSM 46488]|uniref:Uncharacterized protein n=1 Tax=Streptantibioticus cattleyicolor (strain ATCC 35852 / DSM 46488 / JCM 4925 / NBRC 14057 / NRRL 8057) TaxID=1003195 RepID=G8XDG0_STREN|nr:hypothetical protein SCATT_p09120 [Streptantibioticus cattleyicolor NRRL 8057 = DSM 46488]
MRRVTDPCGAARPGVRPRRRPEHHHTTGPVPLTGYRRRAYRDGGRGLPRRVTA